MLLVIVMVLNSFNKDFVELKFSKEIYNKEVLIEACYILLDDYYFYLDLDENNFIVSIFEKEKNFDKQEVIGIFLDELIETSAHKNQLKNTQKLREILLEKALIPFSDTSDIDNQLEDK